VAPRLPRYYKLKKVSLSGGPPVTLADAPATRRGGSWGPNNTIVFSSNGLSGLVKVDANGGVVESITTLDNDQGELGHYWVDMLPGGEAVLFTIGSGSIETSRIAVKSLDTGERRILTDGSSPRYAPSGHIVFARRNSLWAVPFDVDQLELTGSPVSVLENIQVNAGGAWAQFTLASDGSLVYMSSVALVNRTLVWVNREGQATPLIEGQQAYSDPRLSPDGRRLAVSIASADSGDIWIYEVERGTRIRLTFEGNSRLQSWTPDGKRVTFGSNRAGNYDLYWKLADGSGQAEQLLSSEYLDAPLSWSPDGQTLAFSEFNPATASDIWMLSLEGDATPFLTTPFNEELAMFSPDGKWLAYVSDESGRYEVYVQPYPGPGGKWPISTEGGTNPRWSPGGRELFYRNGYQMMSVSVDTEPSFTAEKPRLLFEGQYLLSTRFNVPNYDISHDGQRFVMITEASTGIHVVLNWFEELKRLVPTN